MHDDLFFLFPKEKKNDCQVCQNTVVVLSKYIPLTKAIAVKNPRRSTILALDVTEF